MNDLFDISGKTALVTGGSRGIGLMIARGFVEAGAKVYVSSRKADVCEQVAAELGTIGECVAVPADLSTRGRVPAPGHEVSEREGGRLDILVNNAGRDLGRAVRRVRRRRLGPRARPQREGRVPPHQVPAPGPGRRRHRRGHRPGW